MLNQIALGGVGRIMSNANFDAQFIDQRLSVLFEDVIARAIAAASIA